MSDPGVSRWTIHDVTVTELLLDCTLCGAMLSVEPKRFNILVLIDHSDSLHQGYHMRISVRMAINQCPGRGSAVSICIAPLASLDFPFSFYDSDCTPQRCKAWPSMATKHGCS